MNATANAATKRKRKLTALPLLVVLFVISYFLLTKLVIEQDKKEIGGGIVKRAGIVVRHNGLDAKHQPQRRLRW